MKVKEFVLIIILVNFYSCVKNEARRPITKTKTYTLADTSEEMKKINRSEEFKIKAYIKNDSLTQYKLSSNGYWFTYINKIDKDTNSPSEGQLVELEYEIQDLNNNVIYSKEDLGLKTYKVDKEDFIPALQTGIKSMKKGEKIKFVIPSYNAFGVIGDNSKIGINQSIISIVTLVNIKNENENN